MKKNPTQNREKISSHHRENGLHADQEGQMVLIVGGFPAPTPSKQLQGRGKQDAGGNWG